MKSNSVALFVLLVLVALCVQSSRGNTLTGTYTFGGNTVPLGGGGYELTSTASTYSWVQFTLDQAVQFSQLTDLNVVFTSLSGGAAGGSPRIWVDLSNGGWIHIYPGPSPDYISGDAALNAYSGVNLVGNNDPGRYDLSPSGPGGSYGGSPYTTYDAALAAIGNLGVVDIGFVTDTYDPYPSRDLILNSINANASVPDVSATSWLMLAALFALCCFRQFSNHASRVTCPVRLRVD
jgi:hypothetical protein